MITFSAIFARKHGAPTGYPVVASFGNEVAVLAAFREITDPAAGAEFRAEHAEVELIRDMRVIDHLDFPDPSITERQRLAALQADAVAKQKAARDAAANHKTAQAAAKAAAQDFAALSPEQKQHLRDLEDAEEKAAAAAEAALKESSQADEEARAATAAVAKANESEAQQAATDGAAALNAAAGS
jgi:hypothetical protein